MLFLYKPETGEITQTLDFAAPARIAELRGQGWGVLEFCNDPMQNYVDVADPVLRKRPVLDQAPSRASVAILEETVIPSVPASTLEVVGPTSGTIAHPGGDLRLRFALPGAYTVRCDAYPYRYAQWTITVLTTTAAKASATEAATA